MPVIPGAPLTDTLPGRKRRMTAPISSVSGANIRPRGQPSRAFEKSGWVAKRRRRPLPGQTLIEVRLFQVLRRA
jgi:hypothetical protein